MRYVAVVLAVLCLSVVAFPAPAPVPMPAIGPPVQTGTFTCGTATIEVRAHDFTPPREDVWQAIAWALPGEKPFVMLYSATPSATKYIYVDANRDGIAERVLTIEQTIERYGNSVCGLYEKELIGKQASR